MSMNQNFSNPSGGYRQPPPQDQMESFNRQIQWLTQCVFSLQEQNRQLYDQVLLLHTALINNGSTGSSSPRGKGPAGAGYPTDPNSSQVFSNNGLVRKDSCSVAPKGPSAFCGCRSRAPVSSQIKVTFSIDKNAKVWTKEEEEIAKKWGNRAIPCHKGKPMPLEEYMALNNKLLGIANPKATPEQTSSQASSNQSSDSKAENVPNQNSAKESPKSGQGSGISNTGSASQGPVKTSGQAPGQAPVEKKAEPTNKSGITNSEPASHGPVKTSGQAPGQAPVEKKAEPIRKSGTNSI